MWLDFRFGTFYEKQNNNKSVKAKVKIINFVIKGELFTTTSDLTYIRTR